jgi:hypothetical protein
MEADDWVAFMSDETIDLNAHRQAIINFVVKCRIDDNPVEETDEDGLSNGLSRLLFALSESLSESWSAPMSESRSESQSESEWSESLPDDDTTGEELTDQERESSANSDLDSVQDDEGDEFD